jgi:hypothetical protein
MKRIHPPVMELQQEMGCVCEREREGAVRAHTAGERERRRREGRHSKALLDASCMPYGEVATS